MTTSGPGRNDPDRLCATSEVCFSSTARSWAVPVLCSASTAVHDSRAVRRRSSDVRLRHLYASPTWSGRHRSTLRRRDVCTRATPAGTPGLGLHSTYRSAASVGPKPLWMEPVDLKRIALQPVITGTELGASGRVSLLVKGSAGRRHVACRAPARGGASTLSRPAARTPAASSHNRPADVRERHQRDCERPALRLERPDELRRSHRLGLDTGRSLEILFE